MSVNDGVSTRDDGEIDRALRALADANRRAILDVLRRDAHAVGEVAETVGLSQQATSHHLRVLRTAGIVTETRAGVRHLFAIDSDGLSVVRSYLDDFWPTRLSALRVAIESNTGRSDG